jgi:hypothetical protein
MRSILIAAFSISVFAVVPSAHAQAHSVAYIFDGNSLYMTSDDTMTVKDAEYFVGDFHDCEKARINRGIPRIDAAATPQVLACMTARLQDASRALDLHWSESNDQAVELCTKYAATPGHSNDLDACIKAELKH